MLLAAVHPRLDEAIDLADSLLMQHVIHLVSLLVVGATAPAFYVALEAMRGAIEAMWADVTPGQVALLTSVFGVPATLMTIFVNAAIGRRAHLAEVRRQRLAYREALLAEALAIEEFLQGHVSRLRHNLEGFESTEAWGDGGVKLLKDTFQINRIETPIYDAMASNFSVLDPDIPKMAIRAYRELNNLLDQREYLSIDSLLKERKHAMSYAHSTINITERTHAQFVLLIHGLSISPNY